MVNCRYEAVCVSIRKFGMCPGNLPKFAEAVAWVGGLAVSDDLYES